MKTEISETTAAEGISPSLPQPYLLFLGDVTNPSYAKTAFGLRDWVPELCIGEWGSGAETVSTGLPRLLPSEAYAAGARSLVIGVANSGGTIPTSWIPMLAEAMRAGLDIVSGMHVSLSAFPALSLEAKRLGRGLYDIRRSPQNLPVGTGRKRTGKRILTVGTDCALGKKYTALAITRRLQDRGVDATFRATGQTGIMISGSGMPMDAVVSDFLAGAAEILTPDAPENHWDVIEGQGSLFHPAYAAVSLGLLHGSQPDVIVMCHDPLRTEILGAPGYEVPSVGKAISLNLTLAELTNPTVRCAGISLNTSALDEAVAADIIKALEVELGLPVADPLRTDGGFDSIVDNILNKNLAYA